MWKKVTNNTQLTRECIYTSSIGLGYLYGGSGGESGVIGALSRSPSFAPNINKMADSFILIINNFAFNNCNTIECGAATGLIGGVLAFGIARNPSVCDLMCADANFALENIKQSCVTDPEQPSTLDCSTICP